MIAKTNSSFIKAQPVGETPLNNNINNNNNNNNNVVLFGLLIAKKNEHPINKSTLSTPKQQSCLG